MNSTAISHKFIVGQDVNFAILFNVIILVKVTSINIKIEEGKISVSYDLETENKFSYYNVSENILVEYMDLPLSPTQD